MIRNIIFDYGGVIVDLDFNRPHVELEKYGVVNSPEIFSQLRQRELFDELDKGKVSESDFRNAIREQTGIPLTDEQIDLAWNSMLLGVREEKIKTLTSLISS